MYMPQEVNKRTHSHSHIQLNMSTVMFSLCYNNFLGGGGEGGRGGGGCWEQFSRNRDDL